MHRATTMGHADETRQRWEDIAWVETVCDRWEAFFRSLLGEPWKAEALCSLGLKLVRGEVCAAPQSTSSVWFTFFSSLFGKPTVAAQLCALGMQVVRGDIVLSPNGARQTARSILEGR